MKEKRFPLCIDRRGVSPSPTLGCECLSLAKSPVHAWFLLLGASLLTLPLSCPAPAKITDVMRQWSWGPLLDHRRPPQPR